MTMLNYKEFLTEDRVQFVKDWYYAQVDKLIVKERENKGDFVGSLIKLKEPVYDFAFLSDPTQKKIYMQWMLKFFLRIMADLRYTQFNINRIIREDSVTWKQTLERFEEVKPRMPVTERDINNYSGMSSLIPWLEKYRDVKSERALKRDEVARFKQDITVVYGGSEGSIYIPHSWEASQYLGRGTQWCTAMKNERSWFDRYNKIGNLYDLVFKDGTKWQFHLESQQYMDERDEALSDRELKGNPLVLKLIENLPQRDMKYIVHDLIYHYDYMVPEKVLDRLEPRQRFDVVVMFKHRDKKTEDWLNSYISNLSYAFSYAVRLNVHLKIIEMEGPLHDDPQSLRTYLQNVDGAKFDLDSLAKTENVRFMAEYAYHNLGQTYPQLEKLVNYQLKDFLKDKHHFGINMYNDVIMYATEIKKNRWKELEPFIYHLGERNHYAVQYMEAHHVTYENLVH